MSSPESDEGCWDQYAASLRLAGARVLVVGGGTVAARKVASLLGTGAEISVVSPVAAAELEALADANRIRWIRRDYRAGDVAGCRLVFAATGERSVNGAVAEDADRAGAWVNVVDEPSASTFHVPASVRRGGLTIAVSTAGASPLLARRLRAELEAQYGAEYGDLVTLLARMRSKANAALRTEAARRRLYVALLESDVLELLRDGKHDIADARAESLLEAASDDGDST